MRTLNKGNKAPYNGYLLGVREYNEYKDLKELLPLVLKELKELKER